MNVVEHIERAAARHPQRSAVILERVLREQAARQG
jgi:hypothetical protein